MDTYCFVCRRCTDHFGEHDALVEAGLATYDTTSGNVYRTEMWDDTLAAEISEREYQQFVTSLNV